MENAGANQSNSGEKKLALFFSPVRKRECGFRHGTWARIRTSSLGTDAIARKWPAAVLIAFLGHKVNIKNGDSHGKPMMKEEYL